MPKFINLKFIIFFLILLFNHDSFCQKKDFNGIHVIRPIKCFIENEAKTLKPVDRKYGPAEFGEVFYSYEDVDGKSESKCGITSKSGEFLLPKIFSSINIWHSNPELAFVKGTNYAIFNLKNKKWILSCDNIFDSAHDSNYFVIEKCQEAYLLNKDCKIVFHKSNYTISDIICSESIIVRNKLTGLYGVYDVKKNTFLIKDNFKHIKKPYKFNALIAIDKNRFEYLYNINGERINEEKYLQHSHSHGTDICIFQTIKGENKIMNSEGKEVAKKLEDSLLTTAFKYFTRIEIFKDELIFKKKINVNHKTYFIVTDFNGKYALLNENKENLLPYEYDFIEQTGEKIISSKNDDSKLFEINDDNIHIIKNVKKARIFNSVFGYLISYDNWFETIKNESRKFLPYPIKAAKRVWDRSAIETFFFQDTMGKWSVYYDDDRSKEKYDNITTVNEVQDNSMLPIRYINICKNGLWGLCDLKGNEVVKPMFDEIIRTDSDYLVVKIKNKYGIFNVDTKRYIFDPTYDFIMFLSPYKYYAEKNEEQFYLQF